MKVNGNDLGRIVPMEGEKNSKREQSEQNRSIRMRKRIAMGTTTTKIIDTFSGPSNMTFSMDNLNISDIINLIKK